MDENLRTLMHYRLLLTKKVQSLPSTTDSNGETAQSSPSMTNNNGEKVKSKYEPPIRLAPFKKETL